MQAALWLTFLFIFSSLAHAGGPLGSAIQGTLYSPSGTVVTSLDVDFTVQVYDKSKTCLLYEEIHSGVDLSTTRGAFSLELGKGDLRSNKIDNSSELGNNIFRNDSSPVTVTGCSSPLVFADGDERYVRVTFIVDASGTVPVGPITLEPDLKIGSSPYASIAATLNGKSDSDFVQIKNNANVLLTQQNLEFAFSSTNYPRLQSLLTAGQTLTNIGAPTFGTDAVNKSYADSYVGGKSIDLTGIGPAIGNGKVLTWDATAGKWVASQPSTGITSLTGDITASGSGSVIASIATDAVTNTKIANGAISSAKIDSNYAINRLVVTDGTTGSTLTYSVCQNVNEVLKWTTNGWQCATVAALSPVTSVAGKTGNISLNANDIDGLGTAAIRNVGTADGNVVALTATGLPAVDGGQLTNVNATRLQSRSIASAAPTSGQVLMWNGSQWEPSTFVASSTDNLGNHTATQNLALNGNWLSGDGGNEGVFVSSSGNVGIGTTSPTTKLEISSGTSGVSGLKFTNFNSSTATSVGQAVGVDASGNLVTVAASGTSFPLAGSSGSASMPTYSFNGDTDTGWYSPGAGILASANNGTEQMRIDASGNIGVGTISPSSRLHIVGSATFETSDIFVKSSSEARVNLEVTGGSNNYIFGGYDSFGINVGLALPFYYNLTSDYLQLSTGNNPRLHILSSGNIGINTSAPAVRLDVNGVTNVKRIDSIQTDSAIYTGSSASANPDGALNYFTNTSTATGTASHINWQSGTNQRAYMGIVRSPSGNTPAIVIGQQTAATQTTERMRIDANGNVGIGTTSPGAKLEITSGSAGVSGLKFSNFNSATATSTGQAVGVDTSGNLVTIAANSITYPLTGSLGSASAPTFSFAGNTDTGWFSPGAGLLAASTSSTERIRIDSTGNIGIGTTSPNAKLDVSGGAVASSFLMKDNLGVARAGLNLNTGTGMLSVTNSSFGGNFPINFLIGGNERVRIDSGGKVGIGTSSPSGLLDVYSGLGTGQIMLGGVNGISIPTADSNSLAIGARALNSMSTAGTYRNVAVGYESLLSASTGASLTAVGHSALRANTSGNFNSAFGTVALYSNTTGNYNAAFGQSALASSTTSSGNSAFGAQALQLNTTGTESTAVGYNALGNLTTGYFNVAIGASAGALANGLNPNTGTSNSIFIGRATSALTSSDTNSIVIGDAANGEGSNSVVLGNTSITKTILRGNVGIGTTSPTVKMEISSGVANTSGLKFTNFSSTTPTSTGQAVGVDASGNLVTIASGGGSVTYPLAGSIGSAAAPTYSFTGDTDTGWFSPSAGILAASTNSTERLRIDASGNVGIGTDSPTNTLSVNGSANFGSNNTVTNSLSLAIGSFNNVSGSYSIASGNSSSAGSAYSIALGRGAVTSGATFGAWAIGNNVSATADQTLALGSFATASAANSIVIGSGVDNSNRLINNVSKSLAVGFNSTIPTFFVGPSSGAGTIGNVGIGTTSPTAHLQLAAGGSSPGTAPLKFTSGSTKLTSNEDGAMEYDGSSYYLTTGGTRYIIPLNGAAATFSNLTASSKLSLASGSAAAPSLNFITNNSTGLFQPTTNILAMSTAGTERLRIDISGNVGIGTTTPTAKLEISSGVANTSGLKFTNFSSTTPTSTGQAIGVDASGNLVTINSSGSSQWTTTGSDIYYTSGKVGIGTNLPGNRLDVQTTSNSVTGSQNTFFSQMITNAPSASSAATRGAYLYNYWNGPTASSNAEVMGSSSLAEAGSSAGLGLLTGATQRAQLSSTGTVTTAIGSTSEVISSAAGTITNARGGSFAVTRSSGTITNGYGVYIEAIEATNKYGVYQLDSTAKNYFAGNVGIGTTSPVAALDVAGAGTQSAIIIPRDTTANRPPNAVNGMIRYNTTTTGFEGYANGAWGSLGGGSSQWTTTGSNIYYNTGNVGIGTTSPTEMALSVGNGTTNDGGFIAKGYGTVGTDGATLTTTGAGTRMIWYPKKAAFRVGAVYSTQWDDANIGSFSFASGVDSKASSSYATAMGYSTTASGNSATAMGYSTTASGNYATAMGYSTISSGGFASTSMGFGTTASGYYSTAMGNFTTAASQSETVIGQFNVLLGGSASSWVNTDPLFVIGNGTSAGTRSNAMTVLKNGNIGIGSTSPTQKLDVSGTVKATAFSGDGSALTNIAAADSTRVAKAGDTMTGALNLPAGTAAAPSLGLTSAGLYSPGTSLIGLATAGTERVRIDASGNVGIGTTASASQLEVAASGSDSSLFATGYGTGSSGVFVGRAARGTAAAPTATQANDWLAGFGGRGYGTSFSGSSQAAIVFKASENYTASAQGSFITFETTPNGSTVRSERVRIDNAGNIGIGTSGPGTLLDVSGAITSRPSGTGTGQTGQLIMRELAANGTNAVILKAPDSLAADLTWVLPSTNGTNGQFLTTNGSGTLSWSTASGGVTYPLTGSLGTAAAPTYTFTGDTDTGWFSPAAGVLAASTNATERIRIDASGNVGIGTTSPLAPLHVNGVIAAGGSARTKVDGNDTGYFENANNYTQFHMYNSASTAEGYVSISNTGNLNMGTAGNDTSTGMQVWTKSNHRLSFGTNALDRMTILGSGYVGIGTTNPQSLLNVSVASGGSKTDVLSLSSSTAGAGTQPVIRFDTFPANSNVLARISALDTSNWSGALVFETASNKGAGSTVTSEKMRLDQAGYLGIGTTSPGAMLTVASNFSGGGPTIQINNQNSLGDVALDFLSGGTWKANLFYKGSAGAGQNSLWLNSGTSNTLINASGGNVGIGTTSPTAKMEISSGVANTSGLKFTNFSSTTPTSTGQAVGVDASGNLVTIAGGSASPAGSNQQIQYNNSGAFAGSTSYLWDNTNVKMTVGSIGTAFTVNPTILIASGNAATYTPTLQLQNTRSAGHVQIADSLGRVDFQGANNTTTARMNAVATETHTNFVGGTALTFSTNANGGYVLSEKMRIDQNGNVGIGTTTPQSGLDVKTTGSASAIIVPRDTVANRPSTPVNGMLRYASDTNQLEGYVNGAWTNLGGGGSSQWTTSGSNIFYSTGNVGIGGNPGTTPLSVVDTQAGPGNLSANFSNSSSGDISLSLVRGGVRRWTFGMDSADSYKFKFAMTTGAASYATDSKLVLDNNGYVGIGTATPGAKLEVVGSGTQEMRISSQSGFGAGFLSFYSDRGSAASEWRPGYIMSADSGSWTGRLDFYTNGTGSGNKTGSVRAMSVVNGTVGIGTTVTDSPLHVAGNIRATGQIISGTQTITTGTSSVDWNGGNVISTDYNCASAISFANLRDGGTYTLIIRDADVTMCTFNTATTGLDANTVSYRYSPANGPRTANSHTIYTLVRAGTTVYVSWGSGF